VVGIEPVRRPEHREEKDDKGLEFNCLVETEEFRLPAGILHKNDTSTVGSNNIIGVAKEQGKNSATSHENDKGNVCTITYGDI
jgi:hypothetical protein